MYCNVGKKICGSKNINKPDKEAIFSCLLKPNLPVTNSAILPRARHDCFWIETVIYSF